ncbi:MAG: helix-turn-helix transcriptional regulator [Actinobacteria bacterium]|nr:helix-turn-helix transcriptional regulator [Actinomycetota bacterium]
MATRAQSAPVGALFREWRARRRVSQLELASEAGVSPRHVSFIESGRSKPSREMVIHLAEHLEVPLRERNALLLAAGYAPVYQQSDLDAPEMEPVRAALRTILTSYEPNPAAVVDRAWNLVDANHSIGLLIEGVSPELLAPPINVLRATLHPDGLAPRIMNFEQWSSHLLTRLARQVALTGDGELMMLLEELRQYPGVPRRAVFPELEGEEKVFVPLRLRHEGMELAFFSTVVTFGTALDVTLAELVVEAFFPAGDATFDALRAR